MKNFFFMLSIGIDDTNTFQFNFLIDETKTFQLKFFT